MGGYGSGRRGWASPKETVESCLILSIDKLARLGLLQTGMASSGGLTWKRSSTGEQTDSIGCYVNTLADEPPTVRLYYTTKRRGEDHGEDLDYRVSLTTTFPIKGGVRWWFVCPLVVQGRSCGRRVGKLYLPRGRRYFGCRHCHDLTYRSCQESHKFDGLHRLVAGNTGIPPAMVKRLLKTWGQKRQAALYQAG